MLGFPRFRPALAIAAAAAAAALVMLAATPAGADDPKESDPVSASWVTAGDNLFRPVSPCRLADTRNAGGRLTGATRNFAVSGSAGFVSQGGTSDGCGIPAGATAVAISITTVDPTGNGWLAAYPSGTSIPQSTAMNFSGDRKSTTSLIVKLGAGTAQRLALRNFEANANVIIDINGYFSEQIFAYVYKDGEDFSRSAPVESTTKTATGVYRISVDRDIVNCAVTATPISVGYGAAGSTVSEGIAYIYTWRIVGGVVQPADMAFNVTITC